MNYNNNWRPLHSSLTIKVSEECSRISGKLELGLFAVQDILTAVDLGISHVDMQHTHPDIFDRDLIRTTLGGAINHSDTPNCRLRKLDVTSSGNIYSLITTEKISEGSELFLDYTKWFCGR